MNLPDYQHVFDVYHHCQETLEVGLPAGEAALLGKRLMTKSEQLQPVIMVYGVYNAGKSTLLNALMGRADAEMADRPMTDQVTGYQWRGYTLYDTPGIDAPQEHQQVTEAHLRESDVVLFVVATGGAVEEQSTWQALISLVEKERRVMLIVNNKTGLKPESHEYIHLVDQLRQRLQYAADEEQIDDILSKVSIHLVNARSALKGRLEQKSGLINSSGITLLEEQLSQFLQETDQYSVLDTCYSDLRQAIDTALLSLAKIAASPESEALQDVRLRVESECERLSLQLHDHLEKNIQKHQHVLAGTIDDLLENCRSKHVFEADLSRELEVVSDKIFQQQQALLESELPKTQRKLEDIGETLQVAEMRQAQAESPDVKAFQSEDEESAWKQGLKQVMGHSDKLDVNALAEAGAKKGLVIAKDLLPNLFKGIGKRTIERWAATAGRLAGPAIALGVGAWNIYQAVNENEKLRQARRRRREAAEDTAATLMDGLKQAWQGVIREVVNEIFEPVDAFLKQRKNEHQQQSDLTAKRIEELETAKRALSH
ncbi:MAG: GTPase [Enterobacter sp.]|nr:GTPase [Enterobacter sp.]